MRSTRSTTRVRRKLGAGLFLGSGCKRLLGGALSGEIWEQPRRTEDSNDLDGIVLETIDDPEGAYDYFADLRLLAFWDNAARLRELEQPIGCADEALNDKVGVERGVLGDVAWIDSRSRMDRGDQISRFTRRSAA